MEFIGKLKNSTLYSIGLLYRSSKLRIVFYVILKLISVNIPLASLYIFNLLINELTAPGSTGLHLIFLVPANILLIILLSVMSQFENILNGIIRNRSSHCFDMDVTDQLIQLPLSFIDTSKGKDRIDEIRDAKDTICQFPFDLVNIITYSYQFIATIVLLLAFDVYITILLLALCVPGIILNNYSTRRMYFWNIKSAPDRRKFSYYRWMLTDKLPAMDVRMYDLTDQIKSRYDTEKNVFLKSKYKLLRKGFFLSCLSVVFEQLGVILFTIFVIVQALNDRITFGQIAMYIGYSEMLAASFTLVLMFVINYVSITQNQFEKYFQFNKECLFLKKREKEAIAKKEITSFQSLAFDNVYFKYPMADNYVLNGVTFTIHKGDKISLIGINGAGKTTIVKLMLGLYPIESGRILINDQPMDAYDIKDIRKLFSVLFQSFVSYPLTLKENVALSNMERMEEEEEIVASLKKSGIYDNYDKFKNGLDSYMTRKFDDEGVELSKGQWQKIAISRVYFKNAPIVILDEPSAALDAQAEDRIFHNFEEIMQERTGIMISHRISSARMSNKILVLNHGLIEDNGTHEELLSRDGLYAKLYNLQMKKYAVKEAT